MLPLNEVEAFSESNPIPDNIYSLEALQGWHINLIDAEEEWKKANPDAVL